MKSKMRRHHCTVIPRSSSSSSSSSSLWLLLLLCGCALTKAARTPQFFSASTGAASGRPSDPCYDDHTQRSDAAHPQRCLPDFVNAAFGRRVVASSTCGLPTASRYCMTSRDRDGRVGRSCHVCDDTQPTLRHPTSYLTDLNNPNNVTCWISQPLDAARRANNVSLTLSLGKKFEVCHVRQLHAYF